MRVDVTQLEVAQIMDVYGVARATAYRAKARGYLLINQDGTPRSASQGRAAHEGKPAGFGMPEVDAQRIAKLSANYVVGRKRVFNKVAGQWMRDNDLYMEAYQCALIRLWTTGAKSEALAFTVGRRAALDALRGWRSRLAAFLDELEDTYIDNDGEE